MQIYKHLVLLLLVFSLAACNSTSDAQAGNETYVSMGQLIQAKIDDRPLTPNERSFLLGTAYGVFGYVTNQQQLGWSEHALVCVNHTQIDSVTPEWLHKTMIEEVIDNPGLSSYNISVIVTYTLSEHFPCKNAPKYNPEGFTNGMEWIEFLKRQPQADTTSER